MLYTSGKWLQCRWNDIACAGGREQFGSTGNASTYPRIPKSSTLAILQFLNCIITVIGYC